MDEREYKFIIGEQRNLIEAQAELVKQLQQEIERLKNAVIIANDARHGPHHKSADGSLLTFDLRELSRQFYKGDQNG